MKSLPAFARKAFQSRLLRKAVKIIVYIHVVFICMVTLSYCSFKRFAEKSYAEAKKEKPFDVIIVPGVPFEKPEVSATMKMRILWAKHLYDSGYTKNIIFSGSAVYTPFYEGKAMKVIADSLGLPAEHLFAEIKAEHSTENAYYGWKMAKELGFKKVALASDPFQSAMLRSFTKKYCPGMKIVALVPGTVEMETKMPTVDTLSFYKKDFVSIKEREGFWERFRGTRGKRVKDEVEREKKKLKKSKSK
jgi:hypothetical protein